MKKELQIVAAACAMALIGLPAFAADAMPRSEWHAKVSACAQDAAVMKSTLAAVSPEDQVALLAEVNAAIAAMPGSDEAKGAAFYAANREAILDAAPGNMEKLLAEVFATVPPEFLTILNERFAKDLFSRESDKGKSFTDEQFTEVAKSAMAQINARCEGVENSGVRETFAVLMFLRASGGSPQDLAATLVATMPNEKNRELAQNEWIKPAMGDGQEKTYDPMLGVAQAGEEPDHGIVARLVGVGGDGAAISLLADLAAESSDMKTPASQLAGGAIRPSAGIAGTQMDGIGLNRVPRAYVNSKESVGGNSEGRNEGGENPFYTHGRGDKTPDDEPGTYWGQR